MTDEMNILSEELLSSFFFKKLDTIKQDKRIQILHRLIEVVRMDEYDNSIKFISEHNYLVPTTLIPLYHRLLHT
ncbi:hypothetical protein PCURB6_06970 [Paenibacillus curdlanolyticus]|nr:hypothetical protein PCURB6_06970 [Paenibacillus curdlanolyticus]